MRSALLLFGFGLALRVLFWCATADRWDVHAAAFQGDAPVWQQLAANAARAVPDVRLELPLRPPALHWLVSSLWDGEAARAWRLRLLFAVLGACLGPLVYLLARRDLAEATAFAAGALTAAASSLLILGSGPHGEVPYLLLVLISLFDQERLRSEPATRVALRFGALHGALCLLRAEHALTFAAFLALLAWQRAPRWPRTAVAALAAGALVLAPWHVVAWSRIDAHNRGAAPQLRAPGGMPWEAAALARLATLPAFQQGPVLQFVSDTVRVRGGSRVRAEDLEVVREAYGTWPEPLPFSFVCLHGGLNFFLANSPEADAGFSGRALDRAPPLRGGDARYPPGLRDVLPRSGTLVLSYPPHLGRVVHGYRDGLGELLADPAAALFRVARKLGHAFEGAAPGFGGYALPVGMSGTRRPVDLVTADGAWAWIWRVLLLALAARGCWSLRGQAWFQPWLVFAATKVVVVLAFFGYARHGAFCVPVVMVGIAAALSRWLPRCSRPGLVLLGLLALEGWRAVTAEVAVTLPDGQPAILAPDDHRVVVVTWR